MKDKFCTSVLEFYFEFETRSDGFRMLFYTGRGALSSENVVLVWMLEHLPL